MFDVLGDRYLRHQMISWFSQESIQNARIAVVGTGAVGNEVIKNLALLGVGKIDIFDFDTIEPHNLTRSVLFREDDIGKTKASTAAHAASALDPNVTVTPYHGDFWNTLTVSRLKEYNAVISCIDSLEGRIKLNRLCRLFGKLFINSGIDSRYVNCEIYPFDVTPSSPCYECSLEDSVYAGIAKRYSCGWLPKIGQETSTIPTTIVTSSIAGSFAASWALQFARDGTVTEETSRLFSDTILGETSVFKQMKRNGCAGCGFFPTKLEAIDCSGRQLDLDRLNSEFDSLAEVTLSFSDMIIAGSTRYDGDQAGPFEPFFERASDHDETLEVELRGQSDRVHLDIRDQFTIDELTSIFSDKMIPAKYAVASDQKRSVLISFD